MEALHQKHKAESHALKRRVQDLEGSFADAARHEEVNQSTGTVKKYLYSFQGTKEPPPPPILTSQFTCREKYSPLVLGVTLVFSLSMPFFCASRHEPA